MRHFLDFSLFLFCRAAEAFSMAQYFEKTHNLNVQVISGD